MLVQPYLNFGGRCEEALSFYRTALGAEVETLMRFRESPDEPPPGAIPPGWDDKVMHASMRIGESVVMASDGGCSEEAGFAGFSLTLSVADPAEAERRFAALADGGRVQMPLAETFFAASFGMVTDRFGVQWMVIAMKPGDGG